MEAEAAASTRVLAGRYRLGGLLGRGGMAEVYDGYDERLHRQVAVKLLRADLAADPDIRGRFEVEARSAAQLSHPNVVGVYDTGEDGGTPFIVMERLPGETLGDRMAAGPVEEAWLCRVAGDVLGALGAAHAAGLVHRDVKPGNILIGADGCAKVADFGIAKSAEVAGDPTGTGLLVGTPAYLAPERLEGRPATERSDLYSFGVVLYEALAGAKPFRGTTPVDVATAVLNTQPPPLRDLRPDVDPQVAAAVQRALSKDPAARPATAAEMAAALAGGPLPAADPTVVVAVPEPEGDATLVGGSSLVVPAVAEGAAHEPPAGAAAGRPVADRPAAGRPVAGRRPGPSSWASPGLRLALLGTGLLLLVLLAVALSGAGTGDSDGSALASAIRDLAGRVENGDGPRGPDAAARLETIADQVEAGGGADEANALLRDVGQWNGGGQLSDTAAEKITEVLSRIEGVDPSQVTTTTTTTTTTAPLLQLPGVGVNVGDDDDDRKGKGKGRDD